MIHIGIITMRGMRTRREGRRFLRSLPKTFVRGLPFNAARSARRFSTIVACNETTDRPGGRPQVSSKIESEDAIVSVAS
jgi:hypothetical protein